MYRLLDFYLFILFSFSPIILSGMIISSTVRSALDHIDLSVGRSDFAATTGAVIVVAVVVVVGRFGRSIGGRMLMMRNRAGHGGGIGFRGGSNCDSAR